MDEERKAAIRELMLVPGMTQPSAEELVRRGYTAIEELAYVPYEESLAKGGLPPSELATLRTAARALLLS